MKQLTLLLIFTAHFAFADKICEAEAQRGIIVLTNLVQRYLEAGELTLADLDIMIAGSEIANPFYEKPRTEGNLGFRNGLDRVLRKVKGQEIVAKHALENLRSNTLKKLQVVEKVKADTEVIVNARRLTALDLGNRGGIRKKHWHRNAKGELEFALYIPELKELLVYSPYDRAPIYTHVLNQDLRIQDPNSPNSGFFSSRRGDLYAAATGTIDRKEKLLVHSVTDKKTFELDVPSRVYQLALFETEDGKTHVVTRGGTSLSIYDLSSAGLKHVRNIEFPGQINQFELVSGPNSRNVLSVWGQHCVQLLNLPDGKLLRDDTFRANVVSVSATLTGTNDFSVAVQLNGSKYFLAFLTSTSSARLVTEESPYPLYVGKWLVSREGKAYIPVGLVGTSESKVNIYEPLNAKTKFEVGLLPPRMRQVLVPHKTFEGPRFTWSRFEWIETKNDIYLGQAHDQTDVHVDANRLTKRTMVHYYFRLVSLRSNKIDNTLLSGFDEFNFQLADAGGRLILLRENLNSPLQVLDLDTLTPIANSLGQAEKITTPIVINNNGDGLFASEYMLNQGLPIEILRLTAKD